MYIGLHVKYRLLLSDFNGTWILWTDFRNIFKFKISWKSVLWKLNCYIRTDRRDVTNSRFAQFCESGWKLLLFSTAMKYTVSCLRIGTVTLNFYSLPVTWCTNSLTFNSCTFCPHCIYVFCIYLRTNSDLCHLQRKLIGFYNRDEKCLLRGTNWVFK